MAAVYEAENITLGKRVAVKILAAELVTSRIVRERFLREARAAAAIRSPNICDVYDSGMYDGRPFLVMELLEGESLYDMMTRVRRIDADTTLGSHHADRPRLAEGPRLHRHPPRSEAREHLHHQDAGGRDGGEDPRFRPGQVLRADRRCRLAATDPRRSACSERPPT